MLSRRPRFQRSSDIAPIQVTERDVEMLRHIARHRFLRSSQIVRLMAGSRQQLLRRLNLLFHHGYLERPRCQINYFYEGGSRSMAYGLGKRGAAMLRRMHGQPNSSHGFSSGSSVKRIFLEHTLQVSEFMVLLELACREQTSISLIHSEKFALPEKFRKTNEPFRWSILISGAERIGVIPDRAFALQWKDNQNRMRRAYYFLEADLGTMPVRRPILRQSSLWRKLLAYEATWRQNIHRTRLGLPRYRVLFITTTSERLRNLIELCHKTIRSPGLFLFTDFDTLCRTPHFLSHPWKTASLEQTSMLLE